MNTSLISLIISWQILKEGRKGDVQTRVILKVLGYFLIEELAKYICLKYF